jgi:hypothetical protein
MPATLARRPALILAAVLPLLLPLLLVLLDGAAALPQMQPTPATSAPSGGAPSAAQWEGEKARLSRLLDPPSAAYVPMCRRAVVKLLVGPAREPSGKLTFNPYLAPSLAEDRAQGSDWCQTPTELLAEAQTVSREEVLAFSEELKRALYACYVQRKKVLRRCEGARCSERPPPRNFTFTFCNFPFGEITSPTFTNAAIPSCLHSLFHQNAYCPSNMFFDLQTPFQKYFLLHHPHDYPRQTDPARRCSKRRTLIATLLS